jgi:hypothetical protein
VRIVLSENIFLLLSLNWHDYITITDHCPIFLKTFEFKFKHSPTLSVSFNYTNNFSKMAMIFQQKIFWE